MRRGFLDQQPPERIWISTKGHPYYGLVGEVLKRHKGGAVDIRICDGTVKRSQQASDCQTVRQRRHGDKIMQYGVPAAHILTKLLGSWSSVDAESQQRVFLLPELVEHILGFLTINAVDMNQVEAIGCSSVAMHTDASSIQNTLDPSSANWWISADGVAPGGVGREWVSYCIGGDDGATPRRVEILSLKIPPMPSGPLSVRDFHLERAPTPDGPWAQASGMLRTLDTGARQDFFIDPPIEAPYVRIVCCRNAARARYDEARATLLRRGWLDASLESDEDGQSALQRLPSSIGFFSLTFECVRARPSTA
jgi:hypothetical protein